MILVKLINLRNGLHKANTQGKYFRKSLKKIIKGRMPRQKLSFLSGPIEGIMIGKDYYE